MFYRFARMLVKIILHIIFRIRVIGKEHIPAGVGFIVCANHRSDLDPPMVGTHLPQQLNFMAKKSLFAVPILGPILHRLGAFPVNRNTADLSAIRASLKVLKNGGVICIFPEGGRKNDGRLHPFKQGAALIAVKSGAPILPVCIRGKYRLFGRLEIAYGKMIDVTSLPAETETGKIEQVNRILYERIAGLLESGQEAGE